MNDKNYIIKEDAKNEWMKLVKRHKKKQKGLPALSTLNTDAGNVEHNVAMFNMMNTPAEGSCEGCSAMGESVDTSVKGNDTVDLFYDELEVEVPLGTSYSRYYDDDKIKTKIDWTYSVAKSTVLDFLYDLDEVQDEFYADLTDDEYIAVVDARFEELFNKYEPQILDYFKESAIQDAEENYYYEDDYIDDRDELYIKESKQNIQLDDKFDMSMRTLL